MRDNAFGCICVRCLSVCPSVCNALTVENLNLESSLRYAGTSSEYSDQVLYLLEKLNLRAF